MVRMEAAGSVPVETRWNADGRERGRDPYPEGGEGVIHTSGDVLDRTRAMSALQREQEG